LRLLLLVIVAVLPGIVLLVHVAQVERTSAERRSYDEARRLAAVVAEQQQRTLDAAQGFLTALTAIPSVASLDAAACGRALQDLRPRMPFFNAVGAADPKGRVICDSFPGAVNVQVDDRLYFRRALSTGRLAPGEFQISRANGLPSFNFGLPLLDAGGKAQAVLFAGLNLAEMQRRLEETALPPEGAVAVLDHRGTVLAQYPPVAASQGRPADPDLLQRIGQREAGTEASAGPGLPRRVWAWHTVRAGAETAFVVAASVPPGALPGPLQPLYGRSLGILALAALAVILAAAFAVELELIRPVNAIVRAARGLSSGALGTRTGVKQRGELGRLAKAFDEMAGALEVLSRQNLLILDSAGEGILGVDPGRCITFANPAAARLFGADPLELRGVSIDAYVEASDIPESCPIAAAMTDGGVRNVHAMFVRRDGTRFPADYVATPIRDGGQVVGAVVTFRDVSDRRQLEEQLRQAQKMEALGQLAGGVAHDFNNLLTAILSFARFAKAALEDNHPSAEDVDEIISAAGRATSLTRQLLAFSRRQVTEPSVFDLALTVGELEKMLRRLIGEDVALETRIPPALGKVKGDPGQLEQVVLNLVVNAREAMPNGGRLILELRDVPEGDPERVGQAGLPPGPLVRLSVADTGIGMDQATLARIYEPFFTTKVGKGTGLGLSTVYNIVTQAGGVIRVRSVPEQGTSFDVYLPRADGTVARAPEPAVAAASGTETVLVVEDDDDVRGLARRALSQAGYQVLEASRPSEAIEQIGKFERYGATVHLLVADVILPESSGPELAMGLVAQRPELRVLYTSGYSGVDLASLGAAGSGHRFLAKPFGPEALLRSVRQVLDASRPAGAERAAPNPSATIGIAKSG
jgi:PAS domain S-box-containing protein